MIILKRIVKYLKEREYKKYKAKKCPKCLKLNWKYCFAPFIMKGQKGLLEARVCGNCGFKDPSVHFIDEAMRFDNNTVIETKN